MTREVLQQALEALENAENSLGSFVSDHGWSQSDMDIMDNTTVAIIVVKKALAQPEQGPWLLESTQTLAKSLAREFYPEVPQWECLNDLAGVISQIDNMTTGLMRKPEQEPDHIANAGKMVEQEPAAYMYPADLKKFETSECFATAFSISCGSPTFGTTVPLYAAPPKRQPLTDEQDRALCEAYCNDASDEYFKARPALDFPEMRRIFYAGHRKAWITREAAHDIKAV